MLQHIAIRFLVPVTLGLSAAYTVQSPTATSANGSQAASPPLEVWVRAQQATPGAVQTANSNITGTSIAGAFQGNGSALSALNASQITSGTLADAHLTSNVALLAAVQTVTGVKTFSAAPAFTASGAPFTVSSGTQVTNLNADKLDGLDSSAFLQAIPNPLSLTNATSGFYAMRGETTAANGSGMIGISSSPSTYGIGVAGLSYNGIGVYATSEGGPYAGLDAYSSGGNGVTAYGAGNGVEGRTSTGSSGVYGHHLNLVNGTGVKGRGATGVYGEDISGTGSTGVVGYSPSQGTGVYGQGYWGVYGLGDVAGGSAVYGYAAAGGSWGVYSNGPAGVFGDLHVTGSKFGYVVDLIKNGDSTALEPGDVVEIVGYEAAVVGDIPVTVVRRATSARATAVLGPIDCAVTIEPLRAPRDSLSTKHSGAPQISHVCPRRAPGSIAPGGYGNVVTLGSFRAVHVDSSFGAIRAGDLLVASPNPGYAMFASVPGVGTVVGKALSDWNAGMGEIPVMVSNR